MKGQYENSILDQSLKDLNQEIYWKRERSDVIKSTVLRDIEKKDRGLEKNRFFALVSYGVATILTLVLVSSYFLNGSLLFIQTS